MRNLILDDGEYSLCCLISVVGVNGLVVLSNTVADNCSLSSTDVDGSKAKNHAFLSNLKVDGI